MLPSLRKRSGATAPVDKTLFIELGPSGFVAKVPEAKQLVRGDAMFDEEQGIERLERIATACVNKLGERVLRRTEEVRLLLDGSIALILDVDSIIDFADEPPTKILALAG